jgi:CHAT domain-containing protein
LRLRYRQRNFQFKYIYTEVQDNLRLHLWADLVSLSACETAIGAAQGEAHRSLEQAFLEAGARAMVGSLWKSKTIQ